jgi:hypothetical protein
VSRQASGRRRAQLIVHQRAELEAERDRLLAVVADCRDSNCYCHDREWFELDGIRFLLGETDTEPVRRTWEDQP